MEPSGRVIQVSVSQGGVPKLPVERAWVSRLGLEGDAHRERTVHGGPHRAVCLFSIEAIERLQSEGHPVEPGSVGENLTTSGVEWSLLPVGTRAVIGDQLEIELAGPTAPCSTQKPNFLGGRFSRISIDLHPSDSRMYARVLREGQVRPGDPITILPPAPDSRAGKQNLLQRIDATDAASSLRLWTAARAAGLDVRVLDDGDICAAASPSLPGDAFNHAQGLRMMPQLLPDILAHFDAHGVAGLIPHEAPSAGAQLDQLVSVFASRPDQVPGALTQGIEVRPAAATDEQHWIDVFTHEMAQDEAVVWRRLLPHLLRTRGVHAFIARSGGEPAGVALLHVRRATGLLRGAVVHRGARGRGIQRALIAARARLAAELGCDLLGVMAQPESVSARNLQQMGLELLGSHPVYRYVPRGLDW